MNEPQMFPTGLLPVWDERSRDYPIRALLDSGVPRADKAWPLSIYLDQLQEGACVGFTGAEEAAAEPVASIRRRLSSVRSL